ncbi:MAG: hypothetical protein HY746_00310 [Elusimicrobia bacterium]|nr:hypothetical protein [Elusimicrobiota bacterium]
MKEGKWLAPRYTEKAVFEKDYPSIEFSGIELKCPGCKNLMQLNRKSLLKKTAGWCRHCNRAVTL